MKCCQTLKLAEFLLILYAKKFLQLTKKAIKMNNYTVFIRESK